MAIAPMSRYTFNSFCCSSQRRRRKSSSKLCSFHCKLLRSDKQQQKAGGTEEEVLDSNPELESKAKCWQLDATHTPTHTHAGTHGITGSRKDPELWTARMHCIQMQFPLAQLQAKFCFSISKSDPNKNTHTHMAVRRVKTF